METLSKKRNGLDQLMKNSGPRTGPDADQENFEIRGPDRTRTNKFLKLRTDEDRRVRGPGGPWIPDYDLETIFSGNVSSGKCFKII